MFSFTRRANARAIKKSMERKKHNALM